jgi:putative Mg2+ transporter-C (MgtC) family protein
MLARVLAAGAAGALIGWERRRFGHPAGLRTLALVAAGAAVFTLISVFGFEGTNGDPSRVAAQVATGVGFIGAGAIVSSGLRVEGLTTAAAIWAAAALGVAAGVGMFVLTAAGALLAVVVLRYFPHAPEQGD